MPRVVVVLLNYLNEKFESTTSKSRSAALRIVVAFLVALCIIADFASPSPVWLAARWQLGSFLFRGLTQWVALDYSEHTVPEWLQLALADYSTIPEASPIHWQEAAPGLSHTTSSVKFKGVAVDTIRLLRFDPGQYRFSVHVSRSPQRDVDQWLTALGATAVINGSYYGPDGLPSTPVLAGGTLYGPAKYSATHGAFISDGHRATVISLEHDDWKSAASRSKEMMVSYPLLVSSGRGRKLKARKHWLAGRSFVGVDRQGNVLFGRTETGFFSLNRLAAFLPRLYPDFTQVLNLDGGPVSCLAVKSKGYVESACSRWEISGDQGKPMVLRQGLEDFKWKLPIVLAAW